MTPKIIDETDLCQITAHTERKNLKEIITGHFWRISNLIFLKKFHFLFDPIKIIL